VELYKGSQKHNIKRRKISSYHISTWISVSFQNSYYLANEGSIDQNINESLNATLRAAKDQPGVDEFWENRKSLFFKEYRDYVTSIFTSDSEVTEGIYENLIDEEKEKVISD